MIIEETHDCYEVKIMSGDEALDMYQYDCQASIEWIQIDKQQATQLVEVLQKWLAGEEVE